MTSNDTCGRASDGDLVLRCLSCGGSHINAILEVYENGGLTFEAPLKCPHCKKGDQFVIS